MERARKTLETAGFLVYAPGIFIGECKSPYIVIRHGGTYAAAIGGRVGNSILEVICYVPLAQYSELVPMTRRVKASMGTLSAQIRPTGHIGPDIIEQEYKAHSATIEYQVLKRL